jgi:electron transfer flavoprotein beta subunit
MKVFVPIKRVVDPYVKIRVKADRTGVETQNVKIAMNPFDEIAIEEAVRWKEAGFITEIIAVSIGNATSQETLRQALALGADRAILVQTETTLEPLNIAKILSHLVKQHDPHIVIMGKQAIDDDSNQTGQMLASLLDWPQATFASKITFSEDKKSVSVIREVDAGLETLSVDLPVVMTTDLRLNEPRYASMPNIMQAKRKPLEIIEAAALSLDLHPHTQVIETFSPPQRKAGKKVQDVAELIHYLRDVEKVI